MTTVDSASDARTVNNVMRHEYRVLSEDEKAQIAKMPFTEAEVNAALDQLQKKTAAQAGH